MGLQPIDEAEYRQLEKDLYIFIQQSQDHTDIAWHETRNKLCKFLWERGYCRVE